MIVIGINQDCKEGSKEEKKGRVNQPKRPHPKNPIVGKKERMVLMAIAIPDDVLNDVVTLEYMMPDLICVKNKKREDMT